MQDKISNLAKRVMPSSTMMVNDMLKTMDLGDKEIFNLSVGEIAGSPVQEIRQAAIDAINAGVCKYTPAMGDIELRKAISTKMKIANNLEYDENQIIINCGAKFSIYNAVISIADPEDEIILPAPYWNSYYEGISMLDIRPIVVESKDDFDLDIEKIAQSITDKTRAIIINSPNNPTGKIYSDQALKSIASLAMKYDLWIISDEIYEYILYGNSKHKSILEICPEIYDRTIIINGVSKFAMLSGWRVGYACGPKHIINKMSKIQSQVSTNTSCISQKAAIQAVKMGKDALGGMLEKLEATLNCMYEYFKKEDLFELNDKPEGGLFLFVKCNKICDQLGFTDVELARLLISEGILVVPGSAFGAKGKFLRIAFCTPDIEKIQKACKRIHEVIRSALQNKKS